MNVTLSDFGGIVPRTSEHELSRTAATIAHNVVLRNGRIESWRESCPFAEVALSSHSFHVWGCCTLAWDEIVHAAEFDVDWDRLYITGHENDAQVVTKSCECVPSYTKLGVPTPITPPSASGTENCSRASDARSYVYTYVNKWGEEGAPSPASNILTVEDGAVVTVSGIAFPPDGYDIKYANIYRAATGFRDVDGKQQKPLTEYFFVGTIEFPTTTFTDSVLMAGLSMPLSTHKYRMPPSGLRNICRPEGVARLAGTVRNRVYLSENFQPHNWPVKYELTLEATIIHMKALDQKLYVTTDTRPYVIDVSNCDDTKCTPVTDLGVALPDISCGHSSSAIITSHGMVYSSPLGVVLVDPTAKWNLLTRGFFSERDWAQVKPETARFGYYEGFLFIVTDAVSFVLDIDGDPYGDIRGGELTTISDSPVDLKTSSTGKLFMLERGQVSAWDMGDTYRTYEWVSRELVGKYSNPEALTYQSQNMNKTPEGATWSPASVKIRSDEVEFTLQTPVNKEAYVRRVIGERPFRLPRVGRHVWFKVKLRGTKPVEFVDLGTSHFTVNAGV